MTKRNEWDGHAPSSARLRAAFEALHADTPLYGSAMPTDCAICWNANVVGTLCPACGRVGTVTLTRRPAQK